ncbi:hypothetical protein Hamer_G023408 [Homarus americanus]|uniref:Uncharacterized protein n=1 Tax=Homarus americanus TaxID=6706 RepID=A0A8J5JNJ0_HOMAM|nr:hypothetical protein Hamer_G023408 [Homarus americanus]
MTAALARPHLPSAHATQNTHASSFQKVGVGLELSEDHLWASFHTTSEMTVCIAECAIIAIRASIHTFSSRQVETGEGVMCHLARPSSDPQLLLQVASGGDLAVWSTHVSTVPRS